MTLAAPTPCGLKPKLQVEGDGFVFSEEIDVLALEFLDEQFFHAGRYTLVTQQNTATSEPSAPGADGRGELGGRVEITAGRLMVESKPSAGAVRTRAASRAGAENALAQNGKAIATATRRRTRDDIIPLDVEDLNTLQEL